MMSRIKKKKLPLSYSVFDFPPQILTGSTCITLYENIGALIENFGKLDKYNEGLLSLITSFGKITISGENLLITESEPGIIGLKGKICSVTFEYMNND